MLASFWLIQIKDNAASSMRSFPRDLKAAEADPSPQSHVDVELSGVCVMLSRIAYMPLDTYPEAVPEPAVLAAVGFASALGCDLHVSIFSVHIPQLSSPLAGMLLDGPGLVRSVEEKSKVAARRLESLVLEAAGTRHKVHCKEREITLGGAMEAAAHEARHFGLCVLPWPGGTGAAQDLSEAIVFGSGRPTILVPASVSATPVDHIAIAWDGSRLAARALFDALPYLTEGGQITVLTVRDEKPLAGSDIAQSLASSLGELGYSARAVSVAIGKASIASALQDTALSEGAKIMAMGGFGHSRFRDFILGGATKGVLTDLRLPILLSH